MIPPSDDFYFGRKTYSERPCKVRRPSPPPPPTFTERKAGDDVMQDIIDAAECIRRAHPSYKNAGPLLAQDGGVRCFWALMLDGCAKAAGLTIDELIERIRTQAKRPPEADGE